MYECPIIITIHKPLDDICKTTGMFLAWLKNSKLSELTFVE